MPGEHQQIPSADVLLIAARARLGEQAQPTPVAFKRPLVRKVKTVCWWTLGVVLFICALPFVLWGLSTAAWGIASLFYWPHTQPHLVLWLALTFGTMYGTHIGTVVWMILRDRRRDRRNSVVQAEMAMAMIESLGATLH